MSRSWVRRPEGYGARNAASPPRGTRDRLARPGVDRGDGRDEARPGDAGTDRGAGTPRGRRQGPLQDLGQPLDEDRLRAPQRLEAVGVDLEQPERRVRRIGRPGQTRAERRRAPRTRPRPRPGPPSGSGSTKIASGASRCALPSGIPRRTPSARASRFASMTVPGSHGRPPRTSGPVGKGSEARAAASARGRCGR